jgi:hypothetical protein
MKRAFRVLAIAAMSVWSVAFVAMFILIPVSTALCFVYGGVAIDGQRVGDSYFLFDHGVRHYVSAGVFKTVLTMERATFVCVACVIPGLAFLGIRRVVKLIRKARLRSAGLDWE